VTDTAEATVVAEEPNQLETPQPAVHRPVTSRAARPRALGLPATAAGWWAFAFELTSLVVLVVGTWLSSASMQTAMWGRLGLMNDVLFVATPVALLMSALGGVLAISALVRKRERSVLVWFAAVGFALVVAVVVVSLL
jgi:hypothetical protein